MTVRLCTLLLLCATVALDGQTTFRARIGSKLVVVEQVTVGLALTSPTTGTTHNTTDTSIVIAGTAVTTGGGVLRDVTWSNATTSGSGDCSGTASFTCGAGGAGEATIFEDNFNTATNQDCVTRGAPTPTGTSYTEVVDSAANNSIQCRTDSTAKPASTNTSGAPILIYQADPSPSAADYTVSLAYNFTALDSRAAIVFGYADSSNYCAFSFSSSSEATNAVLSKRVAGTPTTIWSGDIDPIAGDVFVVDVNGSTLGVTQNGVSVASETDTFCDDNLGVGFGFGGLSGTGVIRSGQKVDNFIVVDRGVAGNPITLNSGANAITIEACTTGDVCKTYGLTVTRAASDTEDPTLSITQPTSGPTFSTSTAAQTFSGTASDNVGVDSVTWECTDQTCSPDSGTATGTTAWSFNATVPCSAAPGTDTTVQVTAADAAANDAIATLVVTCVSSDVTAPTVTITTNGGANFGTMSSPVTILATASDATGIASGAFWTCANCSPASGPCTGTTNLSCSVPVGNGSNLIAIFADDLAGNRGTDTITVTFTNTLTIQTTTLATATQNSAYSATLSASGGTPPYTWTNNGAGTTLNDSDAECAGLSVSTAGAISGTPTTTGTCSWTALVTDDAMDTDTQALTITVQAAGSEASNDYFDDLCARGDLYSVGGVDRCFSLRTQSQINQYSQNSPNIWVTYDATVDAARARIPAWLTTTGYTLSGSIGASDTQITVVASSVVPFTNGRALRIDDEILVVCRNTSTCLAVDNGATVTIFVSRGQAGTTAASHTSGTTIDANINSLINQVRVPVDTNPTAAHTYLITWDAKWPETWLGNPKPYSAGQKTFQLEGGDRIWWEPQMLYNGIFDGVVAPGFDPLAHVGAVSVRGYNNLGGQQDWSITPAGGTEGFYFCSTADCSPVRVTNNNPVEPISAKFIVHPNRWTRFWAFVSIGVDDYDYVTMYLADEAQNPVLVYDRIPASVFTNYSTAGCLNNTNGPCANSIVSFWLELNTSENGLTHTIDLDMWMKNIVVLEDPPADWSALRVKPVN